MSDSDEFHSAADRLLSSSSSSTSSPDVSPHRRLRFPPASAASLDLWLAAPAPVADRRRLLLHQLGLLPRRSTSSPSLSPPRPRPIPRSTSDSSVKPPLSSSDDLRRCTIRSLDTGSEFIVNEIREDVREVATGRQLTLEEFEMCVGRSPIVQELMRRSVHHPDINASQSVTPAKPKRSAGWLKSIKTAIGGRERRSSDERDTSSEKGGRRSSSATDDSQEDCPHRTKVRNYGKTGKELTCLYMNQEIQAHSGAIWSIKFSLDGRYLATAGEDCVIHVWQVAERDGKGELERGGEENGSSGNRSHELAVAFACVEGTHSEKRRAKISGGRKSMSSDFIVPDHVFALSEKPVCSFRGHHDDVLDLSWSKSQYLLSSSMDKTVRLWHMSSKSCLKTFSHSDYVTCIQFNPVDDRFFISGSLDEKVRIWSIPDRQVVDWNDLHEMVTAACYTPDGQGALVGSHKGRCHLYSTSDNKLHQKSQIDLQNKKRKSSSKKITGFQFAPGSSTELLVTSADSRIRGVDGTVLVNKFKGFRNTSSQISASWTANGKYVICASEDSHVYVWRHDADSRPGRNKAAISTTQSYEYFHCQNVTVAVPWPGINMGGMVEAHSSKQNWQDGVSNSSSMLLSDVDVYGLNIDCQEHGAVLGEDANHYSDKGSATWPEEKLLLTADIDSPQSNGDRSIAGTPVQSRSAWGMVIVTAGRGGEIKTFQNFGIPVRA